jgi:cobalt-zinc-cadmium resistance protein CzcA
MAAPYTPTDLREIQDWIIKPQLRNVPGVTEINSIGGYAKEYQVAPIPERLAAYGVTLQDVVTALERNNGNVGAGYIEKRGEQYLIRAPGQVKSLEDIGNVILSTPTACRCACVTWPRWALAGAAHRRRHRQRPRGGAGHGVHADRREQPDRLAGGRQEDVGDQQEPARGGHAVTVYDRTVLVDKAIATVKKNLLEGAVLVIAILFLFLGNIRAAIITAMVIPLSMLFTFTGMVQYKVSANLMSLGALDFGIIIDGAVVIVENCVRRLPMRRRTTVGR